MWNAFANLKHNTLPDIDGEGFTSNPKASSSQAPSHTATTAPTVSTLQRRRTGRPASHDVSTVSSAYSRREPRSVDYGLWPFDDRDYAIVCTMTNHKVHTDLSLWTSLLTEEARCNCGSTEHSLRRCPAPYQNVFSLNHGSPRTTPKALCSRPGKTKMRHWHHKGSQLRHQDMAFATRLVVAPHAPTAWAQLGLSR